MRDDDKWCADFVAQHHREPTYEEFIAKQPLVTNAANAKSMQLAVAPTQAAQDEPVVEKVVAPIAAQVPLAAQPTRMSRIHQQSQLGVKAPQRAWHRQLAKVSLGLGLIVAATVGYGYATRVTLPKLDQQIATAIAQDDPQLALEHFSPAVREAAWALPGMQALFAEWQAAGITDHVATTLAQTGHADRKNQLMIDVVAQPHGFFFETYQFETAPADGTAILAHFNQIESAEHLTIKPTALAGQRVQAADVSMEKLVANGVFPGKWTIDLSQGEQPLYRNGHIRTFGYGDVLARPGEKVT